MVEAPADGAEAEVERPEREAAVGVDPHPTRGQEPARRPAVVLREQHGHREEREAEEQRARRPQLPPHRHDGAHGHDAGDEAARGTGEAPRQQCQQRGLGAVEDDQRPVARPAFEPGVDDRGEPRLHDPWVARRGERVGIGPGDAVVEDEAARGQVGEERVVEERLEAGDEAPEDDGGAHHTEDGGARETHRGARRCRERALGCLHVVSLRVVSLHVVSLHGVGPQPCTDRPLEAHDRVLKVPWAGRALAG